MAPQGKQFLAVNTPDFFTVSSALAVARISPRGLKSNGVNFAIMAVQGFKHLTITVPKLDALNLHWRWLVFCHRG